MAFPSPTHIAILCLSALLTSSVFADYVQLKSGEKVQGKVTSETDTQVVMEVTIAAGITDEKTFSKADIDKVFKVTPETQAFEALKAYGVGAYSYQPNAYLAIEKPLEAFLTQYPQSGYRAEVQSMLDTLKAEQERVVAGNLKWENRWYTPEEVQKNQYQLGAAMRFGQMKAQMARRDFIGALNSFAQIEKAYPGSRIFPDAVGLALVAIPAANMEADRLQTAGKIQETDFNNTIPYTNEPQKSQMMQAWKAQVAAAEGALAAATKTQAKWMPLLPLAPKSFDAFKATAATEKDRLEKLPLADMRASLTCTDEAQALIQDKKTALANAKLKEAAKLWPVNEQIKALPLLAAQKAKPAPAAAGTKPAGAAATASTDADASGAPSAKPSASPTPTPAKAKFWGLF